MPFIIALGVAFAEEMESFCEHLKKIAMTQVWSCNNPGAEEYLRASQNKLGGVANTAEGN